MQFRCLRCKGQRHRLRRERGNVCNVGEVLYRVLVIVDGTDQGAVRGDRIHTSAATIALQWA
jgi:hypothetical protein